MAAPPGIILSEFYVILYCHAGGEMDKIPIVVIVGGACGSRGVRFARPALCNEELNYGDCNTEAARRR